MNQDSGSIQRDSSPGARKRILVVEDDAVIQRTVGQLLADQGYEVITAWDGSEGVTHAQHASPDLILLDLGLPSDPFGGANFDGFGVMQWLKRRSPDREIPVVILTARQDPESRRQAFELGASVYLTKPFKAEDLFSTIRIILNDK